MLTKVYSTGGIVALGIGVEGWTIESCIARFQQLCAKAFTPREMHGLKGWGKVVAWKHKNSKYKTIPLTEALKKSFTEENRLFGGQNESDHYSMKVAITSTKDTCQYPIVLANYNRSQLDDACTCLEFVLSDEAILMSVNYSGV